MGEDGTERKGEGYLILFPGHHSGESGQLNSWFNVNVDNENVSIFFPRYLRHVVFCSNIAM